MIELVSATLKNLEISVGRSRVQIDKRLSRDRLTPMKTKFKCNLDLLKCMRRVSKDSLLQSTSSKTRKNPALSMKKLARPIKMIAPVVSMRKKMEVRKRRIALSKMMK